MDTFLGTCNFPRLNQRESENLNRPVTSNKIEAIIKKLPTDKSSGPVGFTGEFYQIPTLVKNKYLSFSNWSKKLQRKNTSKFTP